MTTHRSHFTPEKETNQKGASARNLSAAALYYILTVHLFPITLLGYMIWVGKVFAGRRSGESGTAQSPLFARWLEHHHGTRPDEPANRLMMVVPGVPRLGLRLVAGPLMLAHRVSGYVPASFRYPFKGEITLQNQSTAWQTFYDDVVERYLPELSQFVILGAGFDTRAFRLPKDAPIQSFEVDTPQTMTVKREALEKAGIARSGIALVAADFEKEDWLKRLVEAGFDPTRPALFICEGVFPYLDREAVEDTLRKIASTAIGSVVAFDYFTTEVLESQSLMMRSIRALLSAGGGPLKFGIDNTPPTRERISELLRSCRLTLVEQRTVGQETEGKRAWGGFAIAMLKSAAAD
jgi:methyltransferase (TIGR00027 family)